MRAIAVAMAALGPDEPEQLAEGFAREAGHATPKLDVRGVIERDGAVLLVRGTDDGAWTLPGGWVEVGETPRQAVEKEVLQEAGHTVRAAKLLAVLNRDARGRRRFGYHGWKVYFLCDVLAEGEPDGIETDAVGFFAEDALPELSFRLPPEHLAVVFEHLRDPARPASFE